MRQVALVVGAVVSVLQQRPHLSVAFPAGGGQGVVVEPRLGRRRRHRQRGERDVLRRQIEALRVGRRASVRLVAFEAAQEVARHVAPAQVLAVVQRRAAVAVDHLDEVAPVTQLTQN